MHRIVLMMIAVGLCATAVHAQPRFLVNDRANNTIWLIDDLDGNGSITEPGEVWTYFSAANLSGVPGPNNPTCLGVRRDGMALMGDQGLGVIFALRDNNGDGDVQDAGEAIVAVDATNASGAYATFPTGIAFDNASLAYYVNAGNAFGPDAIYRMRDINGDGDFQDPGEITIYVGEPVFGAGNGPFSPQEIVFMPGFNVSVGFLRNSSANLHGVYRFVDIDGNGRADDSGEFTVYFDATNASGVAIGAGFAIDIDRARPGSLYVHNLGAGSDDQIIRLTDRNGDHDAQDAGEAELVFSTTEAGFISVDIVSLESGQVLFSDNSTKRIIVLTDLDNDGRFMSSGEREDFYANSGSTMSDVRQVHAIPRPCYADCDPSTGVGILDIFDFLCFGNRFSANDPYACNCDLSTGPNVCDIFDFLCFGNAFSAGCP